MIKLTIFIRMAQITLKGAYIHTYGDLPALGTIAPDFLLTGTDLTDFGLKRFSGKKLIINIFPSLDTSVCAASVRKFNEKAATLPDTVVLCVSKDLPFAHNRFCVAEGIKNVVSASVLRNDRFGKDYGVLITDGPMAGLLSRAVIVIDKSGKIVYTELVPEIAQEPNYEAALEACRNA